ncbi:MAG: hypothetical protein M0R46_05295 [Candidatus Muirbacterium halophilum]|nr:hypothetical protein [Candidatus Muirbacterium halophilum]MCK9475310.1 hypothetical protein [Candidatus Muirbacterium halophilum]
MKYFYIISIILLSSFLIISCKSTSINDKDSSFSIWEISFIEKQSDIYAIGKDSISFFSKVDKNSKINTDFIVEKFIALSDSIKIFSNNSILNPKKINTIFTSLENIEKIYICDAKIPKNLIANIYSNISFTLKIVFKDGNVLIKDINKDSNNIYIPEIYEKDKIETILNNFENNLIGDITSDYDRILALISYNMKFNENFDIDSILNIDKEYSPNNINWENDFFKNKNDFYDFATINQ